MRNSLIILFLIVSCNLAYAETLKLKSGLSLQGEIVELTDDHVTIDKGKNNLYRLNFDQLDEESLAVLKTLPKVARQKNVLPKAENSITETPASEKVSPNSLYLEKQQKHSEQLEKILTVSKNDAKLAFDLAKGLLKELNLTEPAFSKTLFEILRLGSDIIADKSHWDLKGMETYFNDLDTIITDLGGLDKVVIIMQDYLKDNQIPVQDWIDHTLVSAYVFKTTTEAARGNFDKANQYVSKVSVVSPSSAKYLEGETAIFERFYKQEKSLVPLYNALIGNGHNGYYAIDVAHGTCPEHCV